MSITLILTYWISLSLVGGVCFSVARLKDRREYYAMLKNLRAIRANAALNCKAVSRETFKGI